MLIFMCELILNKFNDTNGITLLDIHIDLFKGNEPIRTCIHKQGADDKFIAWNDKKALTWNLVMNFFLPNYLCLKVATLKA